MSDKFNASDLKGVGGYTGLGATLGSIFPGPGTAIGAGIGGVADIATLIARGSAGDPELDEKKRQFDKSFGLSAASAGWEEERKRREEERMRKMAAAIAQLSRGR